MQIFTKTLIGTVAAGSMAVSAASPALARDRAGGIDAGDVIAGALVVGGIAALAAAAGKNRDGARYDARYDRDYRGSQGRYGYRRGGSSRDAVQQCIAAATHRANRSRYHGGARVTDIRGVGRKSYGYKIQGRLAVSQAWGPGGRSYYGRDGDRARWNSGPRGYDSGKFTCKVDWHGRVIGLNVSGIRGL